LVFIIVYYVEELARMPHMILIDII